MITTSPSIYLKTLKNHIQAHGNFLKTRTIYYVTCQKTGQVFQLDGFFIDDSEKILAVRLEKIWLNMNDFPTNEKREEFLFKVLADREVEKILTLIAFI